MPFRKDLLDEDVADLSERLSRAASNHPPRPSNNPTEPRTMSTNTALSRSSELTAQFKSELEKSSLIVDLSSRMAQATSNYPGNSDELTAFIGDNVGLISAMISERHTTASHLIEEGEEDVKNNVAPSAERDFSRFLPTEIPKLNFE
jgi:hypothetical protein